MIAITRNPFALRSSRSACLLAWMLAIVCQPPSVLDAATTNANDASSPTATSNPLVTVGIEGHYRVGNWTRVELAKSLLSDDASGNAAATEESTGNSAGNFGIETLDGDGVRVVYRQDGDAERPEVAYVVPGSEGAPLIVRRGSRVVHSTRFPIADIPASGPAMIPDAMPWVVVIGDPLGIDTIGANALLNRPSSIAVTQPKSLASFPDHSIGYQGVSLVVITGSGMEMLRGFSQSQQLALETWLLGGGRVLMSLGESTNQLFQSAPWLSRLLPEEIGVPETTMLEPAAVEAYTSTQTRLSSFAGIDLPRDLGQVLVLGRTARKVSTPIAVDCVRGLGRVTVFAGDLEDEPFSSWPQRMDLVTRLASDILVASDAEPGKKTRATSFNDLAGQMRSGLDQFTFKRDISFSFISLVILSLIAVVGPIDYFLVNRLLKRPAFGWITFPVVAIGASSLLVWQSSPAETTDGAMAPKTYKTSSDTASTPDPRSSATAVIPQCNRVEFVDIDYSSNFGRGFAWNYLYTHEARQISLQGESAPSLDRLSSAMNKRMIAPFGYPGSSFGGIQIVGDDTRMPSYEVQLKSDQREMFAHIETVSLAPRSSKSVATRYEFTPNLPDDVVIKRRRGSELLEGSITNPLPLDLLDGMLIYRNWAYILPTRFQAGATVNSIDSLRQKNFRWQLSRQRAVKSSSENEAWNPSDTRSLNRIAEMLMFHQAVGGKRYTTLEDDVLAELDLSDLLVEDRCILVGRLDGPLSRLSVSLATPDGTQETSVANTLPETNNLTLLRLVLPVTTTSRF